MTAGEHSCTRRALLGAAVAGVAVGAPEPTRTHPHPPTAGGGGPLPLPQAGEGVKGEWALALAEVGRAEVELGVVERGTRGLSYQAAEAVQGAYDARCDAWEAAVVRAMGVPAPDVAALAAKVVWVVDLGVAEFGEGEACLAALRGDVVRLALRE